MPMQEGYYPEGPESVDNALDELLCEYVDGTMDPDVRVVFEEYLATDADLAAHVRQLCLTRNMLCSFGACKCASKSLQAQLRVRLAGELDRKNRSSQVLSNGLGNMALLTSAVGVILIVGMMVGLVAVVPQTTDETPNTLQVVDVDQELIPRILYVRHDAHSGVAAGLVTGESIELGSLREAMQSSFMGPISSLPVVTGSGHMTPAALRTVSVD
ncbi:MAG: hypothetical protein E2O84_05245 [Bacteroidetes bacterium]|nr:MAG: hypothetical protein E2O84_05245 [Bacteroidota bacterium]